MTKISAEEIIERFHLTPLPHDGGYFKETYRAGENISHSSLPGRYQSEKSFSTCIYYLITPNEFSSMHRIISDEIFHFYLGDPVVSLQLFPDRTFREMILGQEIQKGQIPQLVIKRDTWQGMHLIDGGEFALLGTTVAPGFNFSDYEHGQRDHLIQKYPDAAMRIRRLTPN